MGGLGGWAIRKTPTVKHVTLGGSAAEPKWEWRGGNGRWSVVGGVDAVFGNGRWGVVGGVDDCERVSVSNLSKCFFGIFIRFRFCTAETCLPLFGSFEYLPWRGRGSDALSREGSGCDGLSSADH